MRGSTGKLWELCVTTTSCITRIYCVTRPCRVTKTSSIITTWISTWPLCDLHHSGPRVTWPLFRACVSFKKVATILKKSRVFSKYNFYISTPDFSVAEQACNVGNENGADFISVWAALIRSQQCFYFVDLEITSKCIRRNLCKRFSSSWGYTACYPISFQFFCTNFSGDNAAMDLTVSNLHMHAFIDF